MRGRWAGFVAVLNRTEQIMYCTEKQGVEGVFLGKLSIAMIVILSHNGLSASVNLFGLVG
jgi:hypothetical protein